MNGQLLTELVQAFGPTSTIMLVVVIYLIRERRNGKSSTINPSMGITKEQMSDMRDQVKDFSGFQVPQMLTELKGIRTDIRGLTTEIKDGHKRLRESIDVQTGSVVKNTATVEQLENKIAKLK